MAKKKVKKKLKLNYKGIFKLLIFILLVVLIILYFLKLKIKNIYIEGNDKIKDIEIIEIAGIKDYPKIYKLNIKKIKKDLKNHPLIKDVKIKRNILGTITITVDERKVLFLYNNKGKIVTSDNTYIDDNDNYLGYPTLINYTPNRIIKKLVVGLNKVDPNIIKMINTMEYNPYKDKNGKVIDETRFKLIMNDNNTVMIDTVNVRKLNKYMDIYISLNMKDIKGVLYLDTITDDNILFESYSSIEASRLAKEQKEAEEKEKTENPEENNEANQNE